MFRYRLQQFMYGRYGMDELNFALIILSIVISIILMFFNNVFFVIRIVATSPIYYALFRTLSRNIEKRKSENAWFMRIVSKFKKNGGYNSYNQQNNANYSSYGYDYATKKAKKVKYKEDKKIYKYFKCPSCSTKLRVPKGKGKLTITCPKCRTQFKGKS